MAVGRPPVLPGRDGLARLIRRHDKKTCPVYGCDGYKHTYEDIAVSYGVSKSAVYKAMRRAGLTKDGSRNDHTDTIPWTLTLRDRYHYIAEILRLLGRVRGGDTTVPKEKRLMLMRWLTERVAAQEVVTYDRDSGWSIVPRQPGDADVIRPPDDAPPEVYTHPDDRRIWALTSIPPERRRQKIAERQKKAAHTITVRGVLRENNPH